MGKNRTVVLSLVLFIATIGSSAAPAEKIPLQYRPKVGEKRTLRVSYSLATTFPSRTGQDCTGHLRTYTLEVEPMSVEADGSVITRIGIQQIYLKWSQHSDGSVIKSFDSTRDLYEYSLSGGSNRAPLGESFTVVTSPQGKILKWNVDAFYEALARNRVKHETEVLARMAKFNKAWGQKESEALTETYGSTEQRKKTYQEGASKFEPCAMETLQLIVSSLLVPFASEPLSSGGTWKAPLLVSIEAPMELTATYTLKTVESNACTIQVEAQRTPQDRPAGVPAAAASRFSGPYRATLKVDRATGCLLARQEEMNLTGELFRPGHAAAKSDGGVPVTTKAIATVEEVK